MKTRTSMLSSLAIAALATVTLNSTEALAKSGGGGGGMRSFSAARSPIVVTRVKTFSPPSVKKLTTTKLTTVRDHRIKPAFLSGKKITLNPQPLPPGGIGPIKNPPVTPVNNPPIVVGPIGPIKPPGGVIVDPTHPPVVVGPIGPIKPPGGVIVDPTHPPIVVGPIGPIKPPVIVVDPVPPKNPPAPPAPPPVVDHPHSHQSVSVGLGVAAAPVALDPPGCVYERSVRKLPGGGLQRVIVKICPDVIVQ
jgi:hypothetical protein